jgi:heme/copper-type cytochrome/quinol oxidase subunit 2
VPILVVLSCAVVLVVLSQALILRSTVRAMRNSASARARRRIEWAYAIVPAVALMVVLVATWQAASEHRTRLDLEAKANQTVAP